MCNAAVEIMSYTIDNAPQIGIIGFSGSLRSDDLPSLNGLAAKEYR